MLSIEMIGPGYIPCGLYGFFFERKLLIWITSVVYELLLLYSIVVLNEMK